MTIHNIFDKYDLTSGQNELVNKLDNFLHDRSQKCFLLKGYAGTGKTFITKGLTEYFNEISRTYILAAPTGKAAKVIANKTASEAYTIHKTIYSNEDIKEFKVSNIDGTETYKLYYDLNVNNPAQAVYIIDEASMIADIYQEAEFFRFGTGFLLKDLLKYVNLDNNDHNKKIIFIGDNAQLPPVGMNFSPALSEQYLHDKHQLKTSSYELVEVVRQAKESGVLQNSIKIREALSTNTFNQLNFDMSFPDIQHIEHSDLMTQYLVSCNYKINGESIIIAHSNVSVTEYNQRIREHFFPNQPYIVPGDKVMATSNNSQFEIFISNGDFGLIKEVALSSETRKVTIKRKSEENDKVEEIEIKLSFRDVTIGFNDSNYQAHYISCKIVENLLYSDMPNLSSDEHKAIYVDFMMRNPHLKPGTKEHKDALRSDPYFNAMKIKFGYAITCHKAQGSEWNNVFVNCKTHMGSLNAQYFRWLYTAITRTSIKLFLLDEPHIMPTSGMTRIGNIFDELPFRAESNGIKESNTVLNEVDELFEINPENGFLITLLKTISAIVQIDNIAIVDIQHNHYQEAYFFLDKQERCRINIYYNSKQEISNITPQTQDELSNKLLLLLSPLKHKKIITKPVNGVSEEIAFNFSEPFLEEFYQYLKTVLEPKGITIIEISSHLWLEKYLFSKNDEVASFDFFYNGRKQFTRFTEQKNRSTSVELIHELNQILSTEMK